LLHDKPRRLSGPVVACEEAEVGLHQRTFIGELLQDFPLHDTPLEHWMNVGELRRLLASKGLNVTISDAHVAQCAIDRNAVLYSGDEIFTRIAHHTSLRLRHFR
jgi:predicted nucleic acid-binding protein